MGTLERTFTACEIHVWVRYFMDEDGETTDECELGSADVWGRYSDGKGEHVKTLSDKDVEIDDWCLSTGEWTEILERHIIEINQPPHAIDWLKVEIEPSQHGYSCVILPDGTEIEGDDGNAYCTGETYTF